ncbi:DUF4097 domain-containing protein [Aliifodinibius sp. S!AR15-10]|uniref:DUF4097 family beta strand repeat-containing protein n=1 Tax=Aliifodinibius sp. S!AR15-10 TaxID=2950437 RepID=UPI00285E78F8|nr:DUF4097 family beta strand repeat-containing protein [Aliifodinibius sp. S!AR15-10]MDR8393057.1 DUF4097 domain-containing protein [Aliifodinibius sp. S!AR15-10]
MNKRNISWEIILAGFAFVGLAIYLISRSNGGPHAPHPPHHAADSMSVPHPPLPPSIVIDLQNLESLKNLRNLKNLKNFENLEELEFELKNLDKIIEHRDQTAAFEESTELSVNQALQKLEQELQQLENGDFNIKLHDKKVFINRRFEVEEASWSEVSPGVFVYRKAFAMPENHNMKLNLGFGNVNIVGTDSSGGEIVIQATGDVEDPKTLGDNLNMRIEKHNGDASFSLSSAGHSQFSDRVNLEATVRIPEQTNCDINTSGGHISVTHISGKQRFVTSGGHISLDELRGETFAKTSGGHITSDFIEGEAALATSGGHIRINKANGRIKLSTGGGHINIEQLSGEGEAKTSGGNISAEIASLNGPLDFTTSAGNISLLLPRSVNADIRARGTQATIGSTFDFSGTQTEGKIEGAINGGGIPIKAHCGYGNVSIKPND